MGKKYTIVNYGIGNFTGGGMNKDQMFEVLNDWNFWKRKPYVGIKRVTYLEQIEKISKTGQIISIVGARRSGKSTIMLQYANKLLEEGYNKKNILYINLEDPRFLGELSLKLLQDIYDTFLEYLQPDSKPYIFLDEVQNVPAWEKFVRALHERKEAIIFVSGSNSKLLSPEYGSVLTGRHLSLTIYPLSFKEFLYFKKIDIKNRMDLINQKRVIKRLFNEYLEYGGFPSVVLNKEKREILVKYFYDRGYAIGGT